MINKIINSYKIVIFYFYSKECFELNKLINKINNEELGGKNVHIKFIDVDERENLNLINNLELNIYPFFYIYKNGILIEQLLGTLDNIHNKLSLYINI